MNLIDFQTQQSLSYNETDKILKTMLSMVVDRNVVLFDHNAKQGELTAKLLTICCCYNSEAKYDFVFISKDNALQLRSEAMLYNISLPTIVELESIYIDLKEYYLKELKGSFAENDNDFILFYNMYNFESIMGSF